MAQRKDPLKTNHLSAHNKGVAFVTFNPDNPQEAANASENSHALNGYQAVSYYGAGPGGGFRDRYEDISTNISVRNEFSRNDYDAFRAGEARPIKSQHIIHACDSAYKKVGIVRNVIDLMADFGSQGVKLVHENKKIQTFAQKWFKQKIGGQQTNGLTPLPGEPNSLAYI